MLARALGFDFRARLARRLSLYKMISASASALRPRGTTLKGWPALGDVYCYVERRRSWTCFKLVHQRASGPPGSATFSPDLGLVRTRHRPPGPSPQDPQGEPGIQQDAPRGSRSGGLHPPLDSSLTPTYLALVPSVGPASWDWGTPSRAHHSYPWGARGPSPRRPHHRPGRRLGRPAPARPPLAPGRPGSTGPRTGTGSEGPAQ